MGTTSNRAVSAVAAVCIAAAASSGPVSTARAETKNASFAVGLNAAAERVLTTSSEFELEVEAAPGRGYCCTVRPDSGQVRIEGPSIPGAVLGRDTASLYPSVPRGSRYCWVTNSDLPFGGLISPIRLQLSADEFPSTSLVFCEETTLYGSYNFIISEIGFLELIATVPVLPEDFTVSLYVVQNQPGLQARPQFIPLRRIDLRGRDRFDVPLHELGIVGSHGSIRVVHNGPPGVVSAAITEYEQIQDAEGNLTLRLIERRKLTPRGSCQ